MSGFVRDRFRGHSLLMNGGAQGRDILLKLIVGVGGFDENRSAGSTTPEPYFLRKNKTPASNTSTHRFRENCIQSELKAAGVELWDCELWD